MGRLGRNDPCWCPSGLKYKKCHWRREDQAPENPFEMRKRLGNIQKRRFCFCDSGSDPCSKVFAASHSISRSASLKLISERSHVSEIRGDFPSIGGHHSYCETIDVVEVSINKASTFHGFCDLHDARLFAQLDRLDMGNPSLFFWQLFYRAVAFEKFRKLVAYEFADQARLLDKGTDIFVQRQIQFEASLDKWCHGETSKALTSLLRRLERIRERQAFSEVQYHYLVTDRVLPFAGAGCFQPSMTMDGQTLQRVNRIMRHEVFHSLPVTESVCMAAIPTPKSTLLCLCFFKNDQRAERFVQSIVKEGVSIPSRFLGAMMMSIENVYFLPSYLRQIDNVSLSLLKRLSSFGIGEDIRKEEAKLAGSLSLFDSVSIIDSVVG